ncbi:DNA-directed RNA polymerase III subunit RPC8 isoform X2 [Momordica charantia]|uniref:DNA-directed RNA polymerase subunit n=1 Tax=Momordica charantia TaxID=3673 RepID=A0A6J1DFX3_MOMCH|nr:DNA-directed RNA polymerase III subunit RPC8 isoform X2 [Momordica charantia]XP_022152304.1 DNA-directed RNA polymerase III subunit RPC8 isoform X2 [Momordica charantia]XP_022152310.1 DNA-directed RNA polymerase III subunit RPC8 isoform X2 [Momordica charantia]XP_022152318.1 DNA-directed RNA polymerase III subunit RPC8 isoform X2 [Momordica charantia]XP_022152325.1 DNA-directed RNA polymerase III subunit RPC8 isoform X2 [Momordica charantia]XP_022152332.1 DNA-directed RNA polymerase III sub
MFYLSRIEHTLRVPPSMLHLPILDAIKGELEKLFLDKVVANLGLCISVYDIRSVDGGFIFPSDGAATYKVVFTLIVFRPYVGEIIIGKVKESDANGLRISLGFFEDIYVPIHLLPTPSEFKPDSKNGGKRRWVWDYDGQPYDIYETDEIKFRIHNIEYPAIPVEQPKESNEKFLTEEQQPKESTSNVKAFAPMIVTGTIDYDGLGPVSWWDGSGDVDPEAEVGAEEDS